MLSHINNYLKTNILDQFNAKKKEKKQKETFLNDKSSMVTNLILNLPTKMRKTRGL